MLPRKFRTKAIDFYKIPRVDKKVNLLTVSVVSKKSDFKHPRFVILVAKSLDKRSSARNRTRRIITEVLREFLPNIAQAKDVLLRSKKILEKKDRKRVREDITKALKIIGLTK